MIQQSLFTVAENWAGLPVANRGSSDARCCSCKRPVTSGGSTPVRDDGGELAGHVAWNGCCGFSWFAPKAGAS